MTQPTSISELTQAREPSADDAWSLRELREHLIFDSEERIYDPVARPSPRVHLARRWLDAFDRLTGGRFK